jgi:hypothetical protein
MPGYGAAAIRWKKLLAGASLIFIIFFAVFALLAL